MSHIERLKYQVLNLVPEKDPRRLKKAVERLFTVLTEASKDNVEAIIDSRDIPLHDLRIDLSEMTFGEDYELPETFTVALPKKGNIDDFTWEDVTAEQREQAITKLTKEIERLQEEQEALDEASESTASNAKKLAWAEKALEAYEKAEGEYDEVYWNTVWRPYGDEPDLEIAARCNLGSIRFLTGVNAEETYLTLGGCGMDLTPRLVAYVALAHGAVDHQHVRYFVKDIDYTVHVMGETVFKEVCEKLNILKPVMKVWKAQQREHAKRQRADARRLAKDAKIAATPPSPRLRKLLEDALTQYQEMYAGTDTSWFDVNEVVAPLEAEWSASGKKKNHALLTELTKYRRAINWNTSVQTILAIGQPAPVKVE